MKTERMGSQKLEERRKAIKRALQSGTPLGDVVKAFGCSYDTAVRIRDTRFKKVPKQRCPECGASVVELGRTADGKVLCVACAVRCGAISSSEPNSREFSHGHLPSPRQIKRARNAIRRAKLKELRTGRPSPLLEEIYHGPYGHSKSAGATANENVACQAQ